MVFKFKILIFIAGLTIGFFLCRLLSYESKSRTKKIELIESNTNFFNQSKSLYKPMYEFWLRNCFSGIKHDSLINAKITSDCLCTWGITSVKSDESIILLNLKTDTNYFYMMTKDSIYEVTLSPLDIKIDTIIFIDTIIDGKRNYLIDIKKTKINSHRSVEDIFNEIND